MSHLTLVVPSSQSTLRPALAHDTRNAMAVMGLNIEMLERLAGPSGLIARDLAERNGGTLQLAEVPANAQFVLTLSSLAAIDTSMSCSLGKRVASCSR